MPSDVLTHLEQLEGVSLRRLGNLVIKTGDPRVPHPQELRARPGPLFVLYVDPRNLRVEKIEHLRVSDGIDTAADLFTSEFFDRRVVGYKWKGLSCRPKIVGHLKCLEDTATGDNFKPLLVATPIGLLSLTYRRAGLLVKVIAAVVDPKVVPITSGLFMSLDEPDFITATVGYCDDRNQSAS